ASLMLFLVLGVLQIHSSGAIIVATALLLISASGVIAMLLPYAAELYPVHLRGTGARIVAASSKSGGVVGALCGVLGLFDNLMLAAALIAIPLVVFGIILLRSGIDTRGQRLEDIHAQVVDKATGAQLSLDS